MVRQPSGVRAVIALVEAAFPQLRGTIRDHRTKQRRPMVRFFVEEQDWSHEPPHAKLPASVAEGKEPFWIIGAISGG